MVEKIKVKPSREGLVVLDGNGRQIEYNDDGVDVIKTVHIVRRIKDGDLVLVKAHKAGKKKKGDTQ